MRESVWVSREQVRQRLKDADWGFKRQGKRVEIWKKRGRTQRLSVPHQKKLPEVAVRALFRQAGLSEEQIDAFLHDAETTTTR